MLALTIKSHTDTGRAWDIRTRIPRHWIPRPLWGQPAHILLGLLPILRITDWPPLFRNLVQGTSQESLGESTLPHTRTDRQTALTMDNSMDDGRSPECTSSQEIPHSQGIKEDKVTIAILPALAEKNFLCNWLSGDSGPAPGCANYQLWSLR